MPRPVTLPSFQSNSGVITALTVPLACFEDVTGTNCAETKKWDRIKARINNFRIIVILRASNILLFVMDGIDRQLLKICLQADFLKPGDVLFRYCKKQFMRAFQFSAILLSSVL